jgi:hypothetical protein
MKDEKKTAMYPKLEGKTATQIIYDECLTATFEDYLRKVHVASLVEQRKPTYILIGRETLYRLTCIRPDYCCMTLHPHTFYGIPLKIVLGDDECFEPVFKARGDY